MTEQQPPSTNIRCGVYCRISDDREGGGLGVARQEADCRDLAERNGWHVADVYVDNDVSAYSGRVRDDYRRMLADVESGRINAIIAWHNDRLHRSPLELEQFITLVEKHQVRIQTVRAGELDLNTASGRMVARQHGVYARYESEHKAERIRRKVQELVEAGQVHNGGPRPFGYTRVYSGEGPRRKIIRDEVNDAEAAIVRECAKRLLSGDTLRSIVRDLNERGLTSSQGNPWTMQAMRWMLRSGRIAGLKEHRGQVVGPAQWPAIIDAETHAQLRALLDSKGRYSPRSPRKYFLTGLVFCSCRPEKPVRMKITKAGGGIKYTCQPRAEGGCGGRAIQLPGLEQFVRRWIIKRCGDQETLRELAAREQASDEAARELGVAIEKDERRLKLLEAQLSDGDEDDLVEVVAAVRKVRARIQDNRDQLARLAGATPLVGIDLADLAARWDADDGIGVDRKRALARLFIDRVIIHPATPMGRKFDFKRIEIVPV